MPNFKGSRKAVQQVSTATSPSSTDLMRPAQTNDLHQRPTLTSLPLVHTEEITGLVHLAHGDQCGSSRAGHPRSARRAGNGPDPRIR
jgi:hypothetical protein